MPVADSFIQANEPPNYTGRLSASSSRTPSDERIETTRGLGNKKGVVRCLVASDVTGGCFASRFGRNSTPVVAYIRSNANSARRSAPSVFNANLFYGIPFPCRHYLRLSPRKRGDRRARGSPNVARKYSAVALKHGEKI